MLRRWNIGRSFLRGEIGKSRKIKVWVWGVSLGYKSDVSSPCRMKGNDREQEKRKGGFHEPADFFVAVPCCGCLTRSIEGVKGVVDNLQIC